MKTICIASIVFFSPFFLYQENWVGNSKQDKMCIYTTKQNCLFRCAEHNQHMLLVCVVVVAAAAEAWLTLMFKYTSKRDKYF